MHRVLLGSTLLVLALAVRAGAVGVAYDDRFLVLASGLATAGENQALAEEILRNANAFRKRIALEWFGEELPAPVRRCSINATVCESQREGMTNVSGRARERLRSVLIQGTRAQLTGQYLEHELTHVCFSARFSEDLPVWCNEGAASLVDVGHGWNCERPISRYCAERRAWPKIADVIGLEILPADDQAGYAVSVSVTQYLLTRQDKPTFLRFARRGRKDGWDTALRECYGIDNTAALQALWEEWFLRKVEASQPAIASNKRPLG